VSDTQPQTAAARMRRSRERQKAGRHMVWFDLGGADILALRRGGFLPGSGRGPSPAELGAAVSRLIGHTLPERQNGGVTFSCRIPPPFVACLVELGWLARAQAQDARAVRAAFCAFVEEAASRAPRRW